METGGHPPPLAAPRTFGAWGPPRGHSAEDAVRGRSPRPAQQAEDAVRGRRQASEDAEGVLGAVRRRQAPLMTCPPGMPQAPSGVCGGRAPPRLAAPCAWWEARVAPMPSLAGVFADWASPEGSRQGRAGAPASLPPSNHKAVNTGLPNMTRPLGFHAFGELRPRLFIYIHIY